MPHHTVFIAGVEYPWSYLKYQRSFKIPAQKFIVEIPSLESFTPGDTIEIKRDGATVAKGPLATGAWRTDQGVKTVLTSFDYRRKWQLLKGVLTAPDTETSTHLENQLANTSLTKGTFNTYGNITVDYGATEPARFDRRRISEEIMFMTGWEFYTNPAGVCDFKSQCGTDRSSTIRFSREEGTLLGWAEDYVQNGLLKVEKVTVIGKGVGSHQAYGSAQTGGYSAGDPEKTVNRKTLVNNTLCGTAATALLADMQNIIKYGVAQVVNVNEGLAFDVFDTINIRDEKLGIDENLRVASFTVEARPDEGEVTLVEVCNITHLQTSGELLIGDVRGRVEDDFARTKQIASLDEVDDGSNYLRVNKHRGRPDYRGIPRFYKFNGEHELGYTIVENGGGTVAITKDKLLVNSGPAVNDFAEIQSAENLVDFTKNPSTLIRFRLNETEIPAWREGYFGLMGETNAAYFWIPGDLLYTITAEYGEAPEYYCYGKINELTWYVGEIYTKDDKVEFYLDGVLIKTHTAIVPTSGTAGTLYVRSQQDTTGGDDYQIEVSHYEVNQEW